MAKSKKIKKTRDWVDILCYGIFGIIIVIFVLKLNNHPSKLTLENILHLMI